MSRYENLILLRGISGKKFDESVPMEIKWLSRIEFKNFLGQHFILMLWFRPNPKNNSEKFDEKRTPNKILQILRAHDAKSIVSLSKVSSYFSKFTIKIAIIWYNLYHIIYHILYNNDKLLVCRKRPGMPVIRRQNLNGLWSRVKRPRFTFLFYKLRYIFLF